MDKNISFRTCSAVRKDGHPCRAWAVRGSEPALCSAHGGRRTSAPPARKKAPGYNFYFSAPKPEFLKYVEQTMDPSPLRELVEERYRLRQLVSCTLRDDLPLEELLAVCTLVFSGVSTIISLVDQVNGATENG